jgi:hypothetical protein
LTLAPGKIEVKPLTRRKQKSGGRSHRTLELQAISVRPARPELRRQAAQELPLALPSKLEPVRKQERV